MKGSALFSVVIPSYNRIDSLVRAVKSALNQGDLVREVIVVDDFSDNIGDIEQALMSIGSEKVVLVKNVEKSNAAKTRNQGARMACAPWVSFLDSDDVFLEGKLAAVKEAIDSCSIVDAVFYNRAKVFFNGQLEREVPSRRLSDGEHMADYLFVDGEIMQTSTLTIAKSFFVHDGFNESYPRHQDYDVCLSLYHQGYGFFFVDFPGTAIFWTSQARPTDKGESITYSRSWALENRGRMTKRAFNGFMFYFVAIKAARCRKKGEAVRALKKLEGVVGVSPRKMMIFLLLLCMPSVLMHRAYLLYKAFLVGRERP